MNTDTQTMFKQASDMLGFKSVDAYFSSVAEREFENAKKTSQLRSELQKGIESGFVDENEFWRILENKLGVKVAQYEG
jgi:hypothetical protein